MPVTIKTIIKILAINLILLSLGACSSIPVPWGGSDKAEQQTDTSDVLTEDVPDTTSDTLDESSDEMDYNAGSSSIMSQSANDYAVQAYRSGQLNKVEQFKASHNLSDYDIVKTQVAENNYFILIKVYPSRSAAKSAARALKNSASVEPWIRSVAGIQKIVVQ